MEKGLLEEADEKENQGDWDGAIQCLAKIYPKTHDALKRIIRISYGQRDFVGVDKWVRVHQTFFTKNSKAYVKASHYLVPTFGALGKLVDARTCMTLITNAYTKLKLRETKSFAKFCRIGSHLLYLTTKDVSKDIMSVLMTAKTVLEKYPLCKEHVYLTLDIGQCYFAMKNVPLAISHYKEALSKCLELKGKRCFDYGSISERISNAYILLNQFYPAHTFACEMLIAMCDTKYCFAASMQVKKTQAVMDRLQEKEKCQFCSKEGRATCCSQTCMENAWITRKGDSLQCEVCRDYFAILNPNGICDSIECNLICSGKWLGNQ